MAKFNKAILAAVATIASASEGFVFMTQAEGKPLVDAGLAAVDTANVQGDKAAVSLTDAGKALAAENGTATGTTSAPAGGYEIETDVAIPAASARRGREGGYPFDKLEIGQSFHVPKTAENPDPAARLGSSVSGARVKFAVKTGEKETVTVKTYQKGADGKFVKDAEGKRIVASESAVERDKLKLTRDFLVKTVDASDPKGEGARCWRVALPAEA